MTNILKNSFFAGLLILLASCNNLPENTFLLKGEVTNYPAEKIYFSYSNGDDRITDSCSVENGKFTFKGNLSNPSMAVLYDSNVKGQSMYDINMLYICIEPAKMNFSAEWFAEGEKELKTPYSLTGSKSNDEYVEFRNMANSCSQENPDSYIDSLASFIGRHPDSYISVSNLAMYSSMMKLDKIESLAGMLGEKAKTYSDYQTIVNDIAVQKAVQPGKPAPDFTRTTLTGETIKLSDFRGKVVLLDFWASWCKPCRASMPHVKELYKKYKDKGLVVICIADDDSNHDAWTGAIEKDGTSEFIHVLRGFKQLENGDFDRSDDLDEFYTVSSIPSKFIINADGILEGVKMEDADLDAKLQELFGI